MSSGELRKYEPLVLRTTTPPSVRSADDSAVLVDSFQKKSARILPTDCGTGPHAVPFHIDSPSVTPMYSAQLPM